MPVHVFLLFYFLIYSFYRQRRRGRKKQGGQGSLRIKWLQNYIFLKHNSGYMLNISNLKFKFKLWLVIIVHSDHILENINHMFDLCRLVFVCGGWAQVFMQKVYIVGQMGQYGYNLTYWFFFLFFVLFLSFVFWNWLLRTVPKKR